GIIGSASNNTIGGPGTGGNSIAFNKGPGVLVSSGTGNVISSNSITANTGLGIDLGALGVTANDPNDGDTGPNNLQNYPVLASAILNAGTTAVVGTLNSTANTQFRVEFFANTACDPS